MTDDIGERFLNLRVVYQCEDPQAVELFLRANPDLLPYVEQSEAQIAEHFPDVDLRLAVELDEGDEGAKPEEKLFILIEVTDATNDALGRLERLDEAWSVDVCEATNDRLVIDLKY